MDNRSFQSAASASPPAAPGTPSEGYPTNGDPSTGTPATLPGAYWFHQIGEELRAIIEAAGLTPNNGVLNQLLTALRSAGVFQTQLATDDSTKVATTAWAKLGFTISLGGNSYVVFPEWLGSWVIQWGSAVANGSGRSTGSWPTTFPTAIHVVVAIGSAGASSNTVHAATRGSATSTSQYDFWLSAAVAHTINYIALGK